MAEKLHLKPISRLLPQGALCGEDLPYPQAFPSTSFGANPAAFLSASVLFTFQNSDSEIDNPGKVLYGNR